MSGISSFQKVFRKFDSGRVVQPLPSVRWFLACSSHFWNRISNRFKVWWHGFVLSKNVSLVWQGLQVNGPPSEMYLTVKVWQKKSTVDDIIQSVLKLKAVIMTKNYLGLALNTKISINMVSWVLSPSETWFLWPGAEVLVTRTALHAVYYDTA